MRIVFMGTPIFAVASLESLVGSRHEVVAVVCQPDRERDKKGNIIPPPVKTAAISHGIEVFQFAKIREEGLEDLQRLNADIFVTAAYGQILSKEILDMPKHGVINVHASLLPKYRGSSPVQHAIIEGERETGVTIMQTAEGLDTGDIISVAKTEIEKGETAGELLERLSRLGAELLVKTLEEIDNGTAKKIPQQEEFATKCPLIRKTDGLIDWSLSAQKIVSFVHGMNPWPIAHSYLDDRRVNVFRAEVYEGIIPRKLFFAGEISTVGGNFIVATGAGDFVRLVEVQGEGKKRMNGSDFVRGLRPPQGQGFRDER